MCVSRSPESVSTQHGPPVGGVVRGQEGHSPSHGPKQQAGLQGQKDIETEGVSLGRLVPWEARLAWPLGDLGSGPSSGINKLGGWESLCPSLHLRLPSVQ